MLLLNSKKSKTILSKGNNLKKKSPSLKKMEIHLFLYYYF